MITLTSRIAANDYQSVFSLEMQVERTQTPPDASPWAVNEGSKTRNWAMGTIFCRRQATRDEETFRLEFFRVSTPDRRQSIEDVSGDVDNLPQQSTSSYMNEDKSKYTDLAGFDSNGGHFLS